MKKINTLILLTLTIWFITFQNFFSNNGKKYIGAAYYYNIRVQDSVQAKNKYMELHYSKVDSIIKSYKSDIDTNHLLNLSYEYNMDVYFILAQGIVESHLGTAGRAVRTKSVFGVGMYDNGKTSRYHCYSHVDDSIEPYINLLINRYLKDNNPLNTHLLLQPNGFRNRYASADNYESTIRKVYNRITK
nr:MAG TPA: Mannosyl-glycoprotein endo-beta-N-acetylglucosaminidase [Caudoviricetes sp.]